LPNAVGIGGAVVVDEDGGELVAPSRPATPGRADVVGDAVCGRLQQRVPGRVPVGVVDVLELVDVGQHHDRTRVPEQGRRAAGEAVAGA
jgi:hypothetical protein